MNENQELENSTNQNIEITEENTNETSSSINSQSEDADFEDKGSTRWEEGQDISLVRVRFPGNSKSFPFLVGKRTFRYGQKVVAMSDRGMDVGYINSFPYTVPFKKSMLPIRSISKVATEEDIQEMQGNFIKQKEAEMAAVKLIEELGLDMQITHVEIIQFGKKMVFYFTAPARVDFRDLVKKLVGELKMRIELRQISVRDRAAALGSIGACGLATCCSTFLKNYGNVSIKMAKNQNLALIPSKINGVCGQIKCCIKYEDDVYADKRKLLPREGNYIKAANGDIGKVTKLHILVEQFDMITEKGQIRRYTKSQFHEGKRLPKDHPFPERFQHVVNETSNVIGLTDAQSEMAKDFNHGLSEEEIAIRNLQSLKEDGGELFEHTRDNFANVDSKAEEKENDENHPSSDDGAKASSQKSSNDDSDKPQRRRSNNRRNHKPRNKGEDNKSSGDQNKSESGNNRNRKRRRNRNNKKKKPE